MRGRVTATVLVAIVSSIVSIPGETAGQAAEWSVVVDGSPIPLSRPVVGRGVDLFIPLLPVAGALGFQVEPIPALNSFRLRRGAGAAIEYDGRTGEIRYGPVVAGQLRNYRQVVIAEPMEELLFPVDGLITLLAVDVQIDVGAAIVHITSGSAPFSVPSRPIGVSNLDYALGITKAGDSEGHFASLRSGALAGGIPLDSTFLITGENRDIRLEQGTVIAQFGRSRALIAGDQLSLSGVEALVSAVRGVGFSTPVRSFDATVYGGRTAGTVRADMTASSVGSHDTTILGGGLRTQKFDGELSFAASSFAGPLRKGTSAGAAFTKTTEKNQMKGQVVLGRFSGFRLVPRILSLPEMSSPLELETADNVDTAEQFQVDGGALGFSFLDTFKPIDPLTITAHVERYGPNFLTPREDSKFNAQSSQRVSMSLRPFPTVSFHGGLSRRRYLAGDFEVMHGFNYGANGSIPQVPWLQLGYFRSVQTATSSFRLSQYSATVVRLLEYSGSIMFSDFRFNTANLRTLNVTATRNLFNYGQLTVHDQVQFGTLHRYGAGWRLDMPRGTLRLGIDRVADRRAAEGYFVPRLGFAFKLPGRQRLTTMYSGERGLHTLTLTIEGPVLSREDIRMDEEGRVRVIAQASVEGRVYLDSDEDNMFDPEVDTAMPGITVWLDEQASAVTDIEGIYRFNRVQPGTHGLRADLAEVPADMVFADSGERRVALLPVRKNVQNFAIVRTGSVAGKVTYFYSGEDSEEPVRKPLGDVRVVADHEHDTYSDLGGNIIIGSLKPGRYELKVDPATAPQGYVAAVEPREIHIKAGEVLQGVGIHLTPVPREVIIKDLPRQQSVDSP